MVVCEFDRLALEKNMTPLEHEDRVQQVHAWQRHYRMEPRTDSRLTVLFARGELPETVDAFTVARELIATEFIYKNTLYGELIETDMRCVAHKIRRTYKLSWKSTWELVRFYAPIALKLMCVSSTGVHVPEFL